MNVQAVLTETLRAPSAHNAQPWRITPQPDGGYELRFSVSAAPAVRPSAVT